MPTLNDNELAALFSLPPKRVIAYLKGKGFRFSWDWQEVWQAAHAQAFTVAKVTRLDILQDMYQALETTLAEGKTGQWFARELTPVLQAKGWWGQQEMTDPVSGEPVTVQLGSPRRLETIYRTNLTTLYNAGRWAEMRENVAARPYWMYVAIRDNRTRKSHLALHGRVFPADDPVWRALYPPNGWRCRCSVIALSERDVKARGLTVETSGDRLRWSLQLVSRKTGEMQPVARFRISDTQVFSPDVGWSYNPGEGYRPDLSPYQGDLQSLARDELGGRSK
jgi:SPP1 gp7 family putative phage head morphogenesis protein